MYNSSLSIGRFDAFKLLAEWKSQFTYFFFHNNALLYTMKTIKEKSV